MVEEQGVPEYLPYQDFIQLIQAGDFDTSQLRTFLEHLEQTAFGRHLAKKLEVVTTNTGAHAILRGELHSGGDAQEFEHDNLPIRQFVANRIQQDTGYTFNPQVATPEVREKLWEALEAFTGMHADQATREQINQKVPDKFPPDIYKVAWIGQDEVAIGQDDYYAIDRDVAPGHILNASEHTYTVFKGGQQQGRISLSLYYIW